MRGFKHSWGSRHAEKKLHSFSRVNQTEGNRAERMRRLRAGRKCRPPDRRFSSNLRWWTLAIVPILVATGLYETHTSALQARLFSAIARRLTYQVTAGPSSRIVFPESGPFNEA